MYADIDEIVFCPECEQPTTIGATCEQCGATLGIEVAVDLLEDELAGDAF